MFSAKTIIKEYYKYDRNTVKAVKLAVSEGERSSNGFLLNEVHFDRAQSESTESTIFEKSDRTALAPLDVQWSDVGSWTAMYGISKSDHQGNVLQGDVIAVESSNSMVRSTSRLVTLVGVSDIIVIDTPDALLVTKVGQCQNVKRVAEFLKDGHRVEAEKHAPLLLENDSTTTSAVTQMVKTNSIDMISVEIKAGCKLELDAYDNRDILIAQGSIVVSEKGLPTPLEEGQRMDLINAKPIVLINNTNSSAKVILTTRLGIDGNDLQPPLPIYA